MDTDARQATAARPWIDVSGVPRRPRFAQWGPSALIAVVLIGLIAYAATNERFEWSVVGAYFLSFPILEGLGLTLLLGTICTLISIALGTVVALLRSSTFPPLRWAATMYTGFFRAIPPLVQLLFWFNLAYLQPKLFGVSTNDLIAPITAAIIGFSLHESAYQAEIMRAGFLSVPAGQKDAAQALGLGAWTVFRRITLPQALVAIIPPTGSNYIGTLKAVSLVSILGLTDLLHSAQLIYGLTYQVVPLLIVVCLWYVIVVTVLQFIQGFVEARVQRGMHRSMPARSKTNANASVTEETT